MCLTGQYGIPRPWYFVFQLNYWGGVPLEVGLPVPPAPRDEPDGKSITRSHVTVFGRRSKYRVMCGAGF